MQVVRDENGGFSKLTNQPRKFLLQICPRNGVESTERLVEQQQFWFGGERARNADTLPLAAGKLVRKPVGKFCGVEADEIEHLASSLTFSRRFPIFKPQHESDILGNGKMRKQPAVLDNVADMPPEPNGIPLGRWPTIDQNFTGGWLDQPIDELKRGSFTAARFAKEDQYLAGKNVEIEPVDYCRTVDRIADIAKFDDGFDLAHIAILIQLQIFLLSELVMKTKVYSIGTILLLCVIANMACTFGTSNTTSNANANVNSNANAEPAGTPASASAESQTAAAEALVADLYKQHDAKKSPFFQTKNRVLVDKYFTKSLADLIWKDATSSKGEVGAIDGDPLYNAQDMEIKNFAVGRGDVKGDTANVPVTFTNFGEKKTITFALKQVSGAWKIDDIKYGDGDSLMKWLKDTYPAKTETSGGEFEGKYQVGDTTCTVKPVKMAFEIKWAKGSGVEMFFSKNGTTFETSPDKGEPNRFEFDDENYMTGVFYRGDGKEFPVKRLK